MPLINQENRNFRCFRTFYDFLQLKKIAKRYKTQYDETLAQKETLDKKLSEEQAHVDSSKQDDLIKTLNEEKKSLQEEMEKLNQNITANKVSG